MNKREQLLGILDKCLKEYYYRDIRRELERPSCLFDFNPSLGPDRREWAIRKCAEVGHDWGTIRRHGGICAICDGQGLDCDYEAVLWRDCSFCRGLGYIPTIYSRRCNRCGEYQQK